ncbi:alcohol dehydrogenase catalytic domain-containing protein [Streptomyces manipurensis]|uniref:alcohol dehydrogenase catalytic domain-containing protein n=1 Tax=Streptomyces manipurensis TaxID=1077945 RepID=UPI003C705305
MRALTWHGRRDVRVDTVPDPVLKAADDIIVKITTTGLCGSDLHLYEILAPFLDSGDILGHEPMGIVQEVGPEVTAVRPGDRVVIPFNISCGTCFMCTRGLHSQCETTQVHAHGTGASLFGYTKLYGQVPGGQAQYLRVPFGNTLPVPVPHGPPDDRYVYLSDVLPTAWQAVEYADIPPGGSVAVLGLGPIGDMSCRIATHQGADTVIGIDLVPERLDRARGRGVHALDLGALGDGLTDAVHELTDGRGPDAVIDAVGMEAHGSRVAAAAQGITTLLPDALAAAMMKHAGVDRLAALHAAISLVRRGGTVSVSGVYGGAADPLPLFTMFDKQLTFRMGQANVRRWIDDILPLLTDEDPLGVDDFATHRLPLEQAPSA